MQQTWQVAAGGRDVVTSTAALRALLLRQRDLTGADAEAFFAPQYERDIHDPMTLYEMPVAVERIYRAIKKGESILVYGDYDADGISSTAILVSVLQSLGANVTPYLPHREDDGYGLNQQVLAGLVDGINLLITVDCGIANAAEISWLRSRAVETIVVDHHTIPTELPETVATIHPDHPQGSYAWPHLCGAGLAWKLASALLRDRRSPWHKDPDQEKWLLDLAVLGTVADMVPLRGENRAIVWFGLEVLKRTKRPGLRALLSRSRTDLSQLSARTVAFDIVPVLNAAGRLEHAQPALDMLLTEDEVRVGELLQELSALNSRRQSLTRRIVKEAEAQVGSGKQAFIFAHSVEWPAGLVGLAAGRLADRFARPAIVVGSNGREAVGSARSPENVNVLELLQLGEEQLLKLGGHARAAGFSLATDQVEAFRDVLGEKVPAAASALEPVNMTVDAVVSSDILNRETVELVESFAPFGEGNNRPVFLVENLPLVSWRTVGKSEDHAKCTFRVGDGVLDGIGFGLAEKVALVSAKSTVDVVGELTENEWRGRRRLQLELKDVAPAGEVVIQTQAA